MAVEFLTAPVGAAWHVLRYPFTAALVWQALVWAAVGRYYLLSGHRQWLAAQPGYRGGPVQLWASGVTWLMLVGTRQALRGRFSRPLEDSELRYPLSLTLQQGVVSTALATVLWGSFMWSADRTEFAVWQLALNAFVVLLSTLGGLFLLYPPMRRRAIVPWRTAMLLTWLGSTCAYLVALRQLV